MQIIYGIFRQWAFHPYQEFEYEKRSDRKKRINSCIWAGGALESHIVSQLFLKAEQEATINC